MKALALFLLPVICWADVTLYCLIDKRQLNEKFLKEDVSLTKSVEDAYVAPDQYAAILCFRWTDSYNANEKALFNYKEFTFRDKAEAKDFINKCCCRETVYDTVAKEAVAAPSVKLSIADKINPTAEAVEK